jgi:HNH endonuclease
MLVCSQWYPRNRIPFCNYLVSKGIIGQGELSGFLADGEDEANPKSGKPSTTSPGTAKVIKSRYKATTDGDAANSVIRAILSNLGTESFNRHDWDQTKRYFLNRCAYYDEENSNCDETIPTHRDHIVPINKTELGEHRLGNLVPSCNACNKKKHQGDFRGVFADRVGAISRIEVFMGTKGYTPLGDNVLVKMILDQAHSEVKALVYRYISIIEAALATGSAPDRA